MTFECQRLLGTNQNHVRLADVDDWLKITAAEEAKPVNDPTYSRASDWQPQRAPRRGATHGHYGYASTS